MKEYLDHLQALNDHYGDNTVSELTMPDKKAMGLKHEAKTRLELWRDAEPLYKYLLIRYSQNTRSKNSTVQYLNSEGFEPLTNELLNFLYDCALSIARKKQEQMRARYRYNELTLTYKETTVLGHIESLLEIKPGKSRSKGLQSFPKMSTRENKLILGPVIPDLLFLGLTPPKGTRGRGFSENSKKIKWIGTAIEVDGDIHQTKPEKDLVSEKILEEMGIYTIRIRNEDFDTWAITQPLVREQITQFRDSRTSYMRQAVVDDFLIKTKLLTIATYLSPGVCDEVCKSEGLAHLRLLDGLKSLSKWKKCPRWLKQYSKLILF